MLIVSNSARGPSVGLRPGGTHRKVRGEGKGVEGGWALSRAAEEGGWGVLMGAGPPSREDSEERSHVCE